MEYPRSRPVAGRWPQSSAGPQRRLRTSRGLERGATCAIALLALSLGGCRAPLPSPAPTPVHTPTATAAPDGVAAGWQLDAASSEIVVLAFREGALAKLGHNHVLQFGGLSGDAAESQDGVSFAVALPLAGIMLDDPAQRDREGDGFETRPTAADIDGTRRNLLGERVLDAATQARISIAGRCTAPCTGDATIDVVFDVAGRRTRHELAVATRRDGNAVTVTGEWSLAQSTLGLTPFSVAMGALRVRDALEVRARLVFRRGG